MPARSHAIWRAGAPVEAALAAYDAERRPTTAEIVLNNRKGGPEARHRRHRGPRAGGVRRSSTRSRRYAEREAIVRGYASMAGFAREQVNAR